MSRAELAAMLERLQPGAATGGAAAFPDVPAAYWGAAAIAHVQVAGLMTGNPDGAFRPADNVTRAELAVLAGRLQPQKASAGASGGSAAAPDDAAGHWAEAVIAQAVASGSLPALPDGTFRPDRPVTRAEAVTALNRLYGRGPLSGVRPPFADVPASGDAAAAIAEAAVAHNAFRQADGSETAVN
ncbi:MAG: S-layer homology domain-containing protein [Paenibacillaceae bacterium]|nr:S-layer homology domain-containing protein [Paenibacillaceae bacterium]